ncbi:hypothetical protein [Daejeonella sp. H1SJ63]|uniref:hypothetical protein n=1 Tax=Daejeonella sp. H1SJ63 TaxID=3034145 RepID=UPI0023ED41C5|nr:hypothetical protein [Daejeonella sp. H1SJ63]
MNKTFFKKVMVLLFTTFSINTYAWQTDTTLAQQYNEVVVKSGSYKVYKNIKKTKIEAFWKNINDTLQQQKQQLIQSKTELEKTKQRIAEMETVIKESGSAKGKLDGLGTSIKNSADTSIPWGLSILFGAALVFVFLRSRNALNEAKQYNERYDELNAEYRDFKSKANEKERKLARELQDERNKIEELKANKS